MAIPHLPDYPLPTASDLPDNRAAWQAEASRSVLLIHDMQEHFIGFYGDDSLLVQRLIENIVRLRDCCHEQGIPVVYTAQPSDQPPSDRALLNDFWGPGLTEADPGRQAIVSALTPAEGETVLTKWRYSAFQRSELRTLMQEWGRDQLLITGVYAHIGCLATALEAFMVDIQAFMVGDAVADFSAEEHHMALNYVASRCGCVTALGDLVGDTSNQPSRDWLRHRVTRLIDGDVTAVAADENLLDYGLDSLQVMNLVAELKTLGVTLSFEELTRTPTLEAWWTLIEQKRLAA
ncbi:isochorismatase family protein [Halomonas elongata]|uniref:isochorismatase family protein n=1 Tax=Halomonas elongata TaxID=2746 RepID=UPI00334B6C87